MMLSTLLLVAASAATPPLSTAGSACEVEPLGAAALIPASPELQRARRRNRPHLQALLQDVSSLPRPGNALPGNIIAFGEDAFIVACAGKANAERGVIAAATYGKGRVVAFTHNGFLGEWNLKDAGGTFLVNAIQWASGLSGKSKRMPGVVLVAGSEALRSRLATRFASIATYANFDALPGLKRTGEIDVILWAGGSPNDEQREQLAQFVRRGGGVLLGVCPWGNQQIFDGRRQNESIRTDLPHNQFLAPMGLVFGAETVSEEAYELDPARTGRLHGGQAMEVALASIQERKPPGNSNDPQGLRPREAANQIAGLLRALPPRETEFTPQLEAALKAKSFEEHVPGPGKPTQREDIVGYVGMLVATDRWINSAPEDIEAAPGHEHFPGAVPAKAKRMRMQVHTSQSQVDHGGWISTGAYAPAGEVIRIRVSPSRSVNGWSLRIGAHKDELWHKDKLDRWPTVTGLWPIVPDGAGDFRAASPFGGLIYLVPSQSAQATTFQLEGVVEAPFFQLDDGPSAKDWKRRRMAPAPWAELASDGVILTVPAGAVRALEDPTELMRYWQRAMACYPELRGEPQPTRPERLVEDIQISAGWMHSGYPVMTHGAEKREHSDAVDLDVLKAAGNWGYFHEFGHNAQKSDWTFSGTGEVTCNLFSLYLGEQLAGIEPWKNPWLLNQHDKPAKHFAKGAPFDEWKQDPGLALMMYATLQRDFGWKPFQEAFRGYLAAPPDERPKSDIDKHDRWMLRMSKATGCNLGPYFEHWGVPTSEAARAEIAPLRSWMPADY